MKIDFHTHAKLAKNLPSSPEYMHRFFAEACKAGLDALCLTEHFNISDFEGVYHYIGETFPRNGDSFVCGRLKIFTGMEIDVKEGGHVLAVGPIEDILALNRNLRPHMCSETFLSLEKLLELVGGYSILLGAAHPFRKGGRIPKLDEKLLKQFNFIELSGKDLAESGEAMRARVDSLAVRLGLPVIAGSDAHQAFQCGCICNRFYEDCTTIAGLRGVLERNAYEIEISEQISFQVRASGLLKKALKEVHALGGDYLSILMKDT